MRKKRIIILFTLCNIFFIFLQIYNRTKYIQKTYTQQTYEKKYDTLCNEKQKLTQQLYALKDHATIKQFAHETLHMSPNKLEQVKKIT